jgi:methionyl-tRNA formyltransferase
MRILILTDNPQAFDLAMELGAIYGGIDVCQSPNGSLSNVPKLNVRTQIQEIAEKYRLIISIHCKQLFPPDLIRLVRCINVHPGYNPFNRGCYPQVFSIINGMKAGVTIHEIDEQLDHGLIIAQKESDIESWDTSGSAYAKIMALERELLMEHFDSIQNGAYQTHPPDGEGNVNFKRDFELLRHIDLNKQGYYRDFLNQLRALTHNEYRNAYFVDEGGRKVFIRVILEPEDLGNT